MMDLMLTPEAAAALDAARLAIRSAKDQTVAAEENRRAAVLAARASGATLAEIANALGITTGRVSQIIQNTR